MNTVVKSLNETLHHLLKKDDSVIVFGEDLVDPYGGAFKVTKGLSTLFPDRVFSTPISEAAITGMAAGMSMRGLKPIVEIMFGDFVTLCADQLINHIAKYRWMFNEQVRLPLVLRAPMGGRRGYGPTHSQTLEKIFFGIPGLRIVAVNRFMDPGQLLDASVNSVEPVLFIENKMLYPQVLHPTDKVILGAERRVSDDDFPIVELSWTNFSPADVVLVAYGGMADLAVEAAHTLLMEDEIACHVVIPSSIKPFDDALIANLVKVSKRMVVVEEGTASWGWGREVVYRVAQRCPEAAAGLKALAARELPIGNSKPLEDAILPQVADIKKAVRAVMEVDQ